MKHISLFLTFFISLRVFASTEYVGNGADVVVCPSGKPFEVKLLDIYEEQIFNPAFQFDLGPYEQSLDKEAKPHLRKLLSLDKKVTFHFRKLETLSPYRYNRYLSDWEEFLDSKKVKWVEHLDGLTDIPDSLHLPILPKGCKLEQIAILLKKENIHGVRYLIVKSLWDQLPEDERVALISHEIIYKEAIELGYNNSIEVRQLNALILDKRFQNVTQDAFYSHLEKIAFPVEGALGVYPGLVDHKEHYPSGNIKRVIVGQESKLFVGPHYFEFSKGTYVEFFDTPESPIKRIVHLTISGGHVSGSVQLEDGVKTRLKELPIILSGSGLVKFEVIFNREAKIESIRNWQTRSIH